MKTAELTGRAAGLYLLSGWSHRVRLQIQTHRNLILPSVKWGGGGVGTVTQFKDGRVLELKGEGGASLRVSQVSV